MGATACVAGRLVSLVRAPQERTRAVGFDVLRSAALRAAFVIES
jgi:hypothetical protein